MVAYKDVEQKRGEQAEEKKIPNPIGKAKQAGFYPVPVPKIQVKENQSKESETPNNGVFFR